MDVNSKKLTFAAACYGWVAVFIFLFGWVRWYWAIPSAALAIVALYKYKKDLDVRSAKVPLRIGWGMIAFVAFVMLFWLIWTGSGAFVSQVLDWEKHNAILNDLITHKWPVYYHNGNENAMLTYYIGSYLIPAVAGKLSHSFRVAEVAMLVNNFVGLFMAALLLLRILEAGSVKKQVIAVIVFVFFGTVAWPGQAIFDKLQIAFDNNLYQLKWAFQQTIVPWIVTALFIDSEESSEHYLLLAAPLMLHTVFGLIGIAFLMLGVFCWRIVNDSDFKGNIRRTFSVPNLCAGEIVFVVLIYLSGNIFSQKPYTIGFALSPIGFNNMGTYLIFCTTFLCYSVVIFKEYEKSPLYYVVHGILFLLPFFRIGLFNDLCQRSSLPALFALMVLILRALFNFVNNGNQPAKVAILVLLLGWGMYFPVYTALHPKLETYPETPLISLDGSSRYPGKSMEAFVCKDGSIREDLSNNYYTYNYKNSIFVKYFAHK